MAAGEKRVARLNVRDSDIRTQRKNLSKFVSSVCRQEY